HHEAVRRATGVSAATLKKAILSHPGQFGPGVVHVLNLDDRCLLRFNPARHLDSLEGTSEWQDELADGRYSGGEKPPGSGGPMGMGERCASESSTRQAANSMQMTRRGSSTRQPPSCTTSGAEELALLRAARRKSPPTS